MVLLLLPFFALFFVSLSSAARVDLFRHHKPDSIDFKPDLLSLLNKYAAISRRHFNRTGEHLNIVNFDYINLQKRASAHSNLHSDRSWSGQIEVGFPPQKTLTLFDTGSSDLVLDKAAYNPKWSLSSKNLHKQFDFSYGSQHVAGDLYTDKVAIGGVKASNVPIGHGNGDFNNGNGGTFGLSFSNSENSGFDVQQLPFTWAAKKQHLIQSSTYQFTLRPTGKATLNVGRVDLFELAGPITWSDKNSDPVSYTHLTLPTILLV